MKVIKLPVQKDLNRVKVVGTFNFLNASQLIYQLENVLDLMEGRDKRERFYLSCHFSFLDSRCKRIVHDYVKEFNDIISAELIDNMVIYWEYDKTNEDLMEFGLLLNEIGKMEFHFVANEEQEQLEARK